MTNADYDVIQKMLCESRIIYSVQSKPSICDHLGIHS